MPDSASPDGHGQFMLLVPRLIRRLRDPPLLSRCVGHLAVGLLVLLAVWNVLPLNLRAPPQDYLTVPGPVSAEPSAGLTWSGAATDRRYLEFASVPFTLRIIRDVLPMAVPERSVLTDVLVYRVQPGDSVSGIAQRFGLKGSSLLWANDNLADNPDFLRVGQQLNILPIDGAYHTVAKGDTLQSIATKYKVEPSVISSYSANGLEPPYTLEPSQELIIPGGTKPYVPRRVFAYEGSVPRDAKKGTGSFAWPISGYITQRFWEGHRAIDIGAPAGRPIVASDSGYVAVAQWSDVGYGRMVIIDHGNGFQTLYAHMQVYYVETGQSVAKGQKIGLCGITGWSTGPHLHFEIIENSVPRNPFIYLP